MQNFNLNCFKYAVVNTHNDVLAVFKFSETAHQCCKAMSHSSADFKVVMTANIVNMPLNNFNNRSN